MSGNFLPGFTEYQTVTPQDKSYVSILGFGAWALGQFATVGELRLALQARPHLDAGGAGLKRVQDLIERKKKL